MNKPSCVVCNVDLIVVYRQSLGDISFPISFLSVRKKSRSVSPCTNELNFGNAVIYFWFFSYPASQANLMKLAVELCLLRIDMSTYI